MNIAFILPGLPVKPTGGAKIVMEYAARLERRGFCVTLLYYCEDSLKRYRLPRLVRRQLVKQIDARRERWFTLQGSISEHIVYKSDAVFCDYDALFATSIETVDFVEGVNGCNTKKFYFIQDFENWNYSDEAVYETYRLGYTNIVVSRWLETIVYEHSGKRPILLSNPIDLSVYYPEKAIERRDNEVAALYHEAEHKGFRVLFETLHLVKEEIPELVVNTFGAFPRPSCLPGWFRYVENASQDEVRGIYSRSSIFCCASINEGFGLTGLESMACGCAFVSTDYPGVHEYAINGYNSLLSDVGSSAKLAENVIRVMRDPALRVRLAEMGQLVASQRNWDQAVDALVSTIVKSTTVL